MITNPKAIKVVKQIFQHFNEETKSEEYSIYFKDENKDVVGVMVELNCMKH